MIIGYLIITLVYSALIVRFIIGFNKVTVFNVVPAKIITKFSIIIPFRNEAENLPHILQSIYALDYPRHLFEVIFVDDDSKDKSVEIIESTLGIKQNSMKINPVDIRIIKNKRKSNSPKKDAIRSAVEIALYEWILTTDADCILPVTWLKTFDRFIQIKDPKMVIAPVTYTVSNTFISHFQLLDFLSLQSATISGFGIDKPFLCNGANLAYEKALFNSVNGFEGNTNIASGDDIFLMDKATKAFPNKVLYLKSKKALVFTYPQQSIRGLVHQRLRWAAKMTSYRNAFGKLVGLIVILMNVLMIITLIFTILGSAKIAFLFSLCALKMFLDLVLIKQSSHFFNQHISVIYYAFSSLLYPFFSVFIAVNSIFVGYKWKDRRFKK